MKRLLEFFVELFSFFFWAIMIFGFNSPSVAVFTVISAIIHESGHIAALFVTGEYAGPPRFVLSGMRLSPRGGVSYKKELIIAAAGPFFNLFAFLVFLLLSYPLGRYFRLLATLNLLTALSNLLPVEGYDGYKIIKAIILMKSPLPTMEPILRGVSLFFIALMTFLSLYFIMKVGEGYWIYSVFFVSMLVSLFRGKNIKKRGF